MILPLSAIADFAVIIPAAGRSERFGGEKLAQVVAGRSILEYSIRALINRVDVACVLLALRDGAASPPISAELSRHPKLSFYGGQEHRALTVRLGIGALGKRISEGSLERAPPLIAIHDAARPAVSQGLIDRVFEAARRHGAAVPGLPPADTIKHVRGDVVIGTLPRTELVAVQTPQAMRRDWLEEAFVQCRLPAEQITDDVQVLELAGREVRVVEGDPQNIKVTVPADLERVERILSRRGQAV